MSEHILVAADDFAQRRGHGYLNADGGASAAWLSEGHSEIEIAGERYAAIASLRPFYDPNRTRVKGERQPLDEFIAPELLAARRAAA